jgi:hypothetical protein
MSLPARNTCPVKKVIMRKNVILLILASAVASAAELSGFTLRTRTTLSSAGSPLC